MTPTARAHVAPTLHIGDGFTLPAEAVTQTFSILAKRGVGKTYTASVLTEELLKANLHVVVVDPIGVWWGLRAAANGDDAGLPIAILGGDHGDVPLASTAGQVVADVVVDERLPVVLDLSGFRICAAVSRHIKGANPMMSTRDGEIWVSAGWPGNEWHRTAWRADGSVERPLCGARPPHSEALSGAWYPWLSHGIPPLVRRCVRCNATIQRLPGSEDVRRMYLRRDELVAELRRAG